MPTRVCRGRDDPPQRCVFGQRGARRQVRWPATQCYFCNTALLVETVTRGAVPRMRVICAFRSLSAERRLLVLNTAPPDIAFALRAVAMRYRYCSGRPGAPCIFSQTLRPGPRPTGRVVFCNQICRTVCAAPLVPSILLHFLSCVELDASTFT